MRKHINLLPFAIDDYKKERNIKITIICLQVMVILGAVVTYSLLSNMLRQKELVVEELRSEFAEIDEAIFLFGNERMRILGLTQAFESYQIENFSDISDFDVIGHIVNTASAGTSLLNIRYHSSVFFVEAQTDDPALAEAHRESLLAHYDNVWLGEISLSPRGGYMYQLRVGGSVIEQWR